MWIGIFIAVLFAVGQASEVDRCQLDGENACRDYSTAERCHTTNYCKAEIWSQPINKNEKMCQVCVGDITNLQILIIARTTREFVKHELLAVCKTLPTDEARTECAKTADENFNKIHQEIVEQSNPDMICRALYICQSQEIEEAVMKQIHQNLAMAVPWLPKPVSENDICRTEQRCHSYSTAKKCGVLSTCKTYVWSAPTKNDTICDMCKQEFEYLQNWAKNPDTKSLIKKDLLFFCDNIPLTTVQQECHNIVDEDFDVVYDDIVAMLDPGTMCSALGLCMAIYSEETPRATCELDGNNACLDYSTAAKCKTFNYCKAIVWSKPVQSNKLCDACLADVGRIQKFVAANSTKEFVQAELLAICKLLPWKQFRYKCQTMVIARFEEIYDDIVSMLDPQTICRALFFCRSKGEEDIFSGLILKLAKEQKAIESATSVCALDTKNGCYDYSSAKKCGTLAACKTTVWSGPTIDDDICEVCKQEVQKLQNWIEQGTTKAAIEKDLMELCDEIPLGAVKDECKKLIADNYDMIYDDLIALLNPSTLCTAVRLCTQVSVEKYVKGMMGRLPSMLQRALDNENLPVAATVKLTKTEMVASTSCSDCEAFMRDFQNTALNNKKVLDDWLNMLKTECQSLDEGLATLCEENVEMFVYSIMTRHQDNNDDPKAVCQHIMMCNAFTRKPRVGDMCTDCKTFFTDWQEELKSNPEAIDQIVHAVSAFYCLQKPEHFRDQCTRYVSMVIKVLIEKMERENVATICQKLEFCAPLNTDRDMKTLARKAPKPILQSMLEQKPKVEGEPCPDCKNFITDLQGVIQNNQSLVQELVDLVKQQCDQLGAGLSEVCRIYIEDTYQSVLDLFASADVQTICTTIDMCSQSTQIKRLGGVICTDCVAFFGDWQTIITNNKSIITDVTKKAKDAICSTVPDILKSECDKLFDEDCGKIINAIKNNAPDDVCAALYFCGAKSPVTIKAALIQPAEHSIAANPFECQSCKFVMEVESMIGEKQTKEAISNALDNVCEVYEGDIRGDCKVLIQQYRAEIFDFLRQELSSLEICTKLGLCKKDQKFYLVRKEKEQIPIVCGLCEEVMRYVDSLIDYNSTEKEIMDALDQACDALPIVKADCRKFVDKYGKMIVDLILKEGTSPLLVCEALLLCSESPSKAVVPFTAQSPIACEVCEEIMRYVDSMINYTSTEKEIIDALDKACDSMPKIQAGCRKFVDTYGKMIVDLILKEGTSPLLVCKALMLCSQPPRPAAQVVKLNPIACEVCEEIMRYVDSMINFTSTEKDIMDALDKACDSMPKIRAGCRKFVDTYGKMIVDLILKEGTSPLLVCKALTLCSQPPKPTAPVVKPNLGGEIECDFCTALFTEVDKILDDNATEKEILDAISAACSYLGADEDKCNTIVHEYGPAVIEMIVQELSPNEICAAIKACMQANVKTVKVDDGIECTVCQLIATELDNLIKENSTEAEIEKALEEVCAILPSSYKTECDNLVKEYGRTIVELLAEELAPNVICVQLKLCSEATTKVQNVRSDLECDVCTLIVKELDKEINTNSTEAEIEKALEEVCGIIPDADLRKTCDGLVIEFGPEIAQLLKAETQPDVICAQLKLCPKEATKVEPESSSICDVCTLIADELDQLLKDKPTQDEIVAALDEVCSLLPSDFKDTCDSLVQQYKTQIIEFLVNEFNPSMICVQLKLCPKSINGVAECDICEVIVQELDIVLDDKSTKADILNGVSKICDLVPKQSQAICHKYINDYGPAVINILVQEIVPSKVCAVLHACVKKSVKHPARKLHVGDEKCSICKEVITMIDRIIKDNVTIDALDKALEQVCNQLPESIRSECDEMVDEIGPMLAKYIDKIGDPAFVCQHLKLCPTELGHPKILGVDPCTYGPSYWCKDLDTARTCNAVTHCMNHVW